jgi:hypothetical protein
MDTETSYPADTVLEQARPPLSRAWTLTSPNVSIGRDRSSDVFVDDSGVSRHHADLVRRGPSWSIIDAASRNGTYVNDARVRERALKPGDRIKVGGTELILRVAGSDTKDSQAYAPRFDMESQAGNISNVAGNQSNYYQRESNLRYIASRRGRARAMIVWGLLLFFLGNGVALYSFAEFGNMFARYWNSPTPPPFPREFVQGVVLGAFLDLIGLALFLFGLIARSGAKREAQRIGADWP